MDPYYSHDHESHKDAMFPGNERSFPKEKKSHAAILGLAQNCYPLGFKGNDLPQLIGIPSAERRARELAEAGKLERRRQGRQVWYRWVPPKVQA